MNLVNALLSTTYDFFSRFLSFCISLWTHTCALFFSSLLFWNIITFIDVGNPIIIELVLSSNIVCLPPIYLLYKISIILHFEAPLSAVSTIFSNTDVLQLDCTLTSMLDDMQLIYTCKQCFCFPRWSIVWRKVSINWN